MSCACENTRMSKERDRMRRLAKAFAIIENVTAVIYKKDNGMLDFAPASDEIENIIEFITPY